MLLDALDDMVISDAERSSLTWLAGLEARTVDSVAVVITHARQAIVHDGPLTDRSR